MKPVFVTRNEKGTGFGTSSDFTRAKLSEWMKKYNLYKIVPVIKDSWKNRKYLEGGIVPAYVEWQYGIPARERGKGEARRMLFKRDFHYDIVKNRNGDPVRIPLSTVGEVNNVTTLYTDWAAENGAPIPNPKLFKLYRDEYGTDIRFECFHDWLDFLDIPQDSMPSDAVLAKLHDDTKVPLVYPDEDIDPEDIPF